MSNIKLICVVIFLRLTFLSGFSQSTRVDFATSAGYTPAKFDVTNTGSASYYLQLITSPGTSVNPKLGIVYNSMSGDSYLGRGFNLDGFQAISRIGQSIDPNGKTTTIELNNNDKYALNGDRLIAKNNAIGYGTDKSIYYSEHNLTDQIQAFGNIVGSPEYFIVKTKSGLIIEFGRTSDSRIEASGKSIPLRWLVNKISDTRGNYMTFQYFEDNISGESYPISIQYTGNAIANLLPYNKIIFEYELRPDITEGYIAGSVSRITKRIREIRSEHNNQVARKYSFKYKQSGPSQQSLLVELKECGEGNDCLNPTIFTYEENFDTKTKQYSTLFKEDFLINSAQVIVADFDNDGTSDILHLKNRPFLVKTPFERFIKDVTIVLGNRNYQTLSNALIGNISRVFAGTKTIKNDNNFIAAQKVIASVSDLALAAVGGGIKTISVGDFNGDGKADIFIKRETQVEILISNCDANGNIAFTSFLKLSNGFYSSFDRTAIGDFNGDGKDDILMYSNTSILGWFGGSDFVGGIIPNFSSLCYTEKDNKGKVTFERGPDISVTDANGDGKAEILLKVYKSNYANTYLRTLTDNSTVFNNIVWAAEGYGHQADFLFVDLTKDGLPELISVVRHTNNLNPRNNTISSLEIKSISYINHFQVNKGNFQFDINKVGLNIRNESPKDEPIFADINLDNNVDIISYGTHSIARPAIAYINNGKKQFERNADIKLPVLSVQSTSILVPGRYFTNPGIQFLIYNKTTGYNSLEEVYTEPKFMLTGIKNGHNQEIQITYQPISKEHIYKDDNTNLGFLPYRGPLYVVSNVTHKNNKDGVVGLTYEYESARIGKNGRGFLGFRVMTITEQNTQSKTRNFYFLGHQYGGNNLNVSQNFVKDKVVAMSTNNYSIENFGTKAFQALPVYNNNIVYDPNSGAELDQKNNYFIYDSYGNVTSAIIYYKDGRVDSLVNIYRNDTDNWFLGRLLKSVRYIKEPNKPIIKKESAFEYDSYGMLFKEIIEPNKDSLRIITEYERDVFGNITKTSVMAWDGSQIPKRFKTAKYDKYGRFIIETTNNGAFRTTYTQNQKTGNELTVTDVNGLIVQKNYDSFGRIIKEVSPDGNWTEHGYFKVIAGSDLPEAIHAKTIKDSKGNTGTIYFDVLDRVIRTETKNLYNKIVLVDKVYNAKGQLEKESYPYFKGIQSKWLTYVYDDFGRTIRQVLPDGTESKMEYNGFKTVSINAIGQKSTSISDIHGQTKETIDNAGKSVKKDYTIDGNLKRVLTANSEIAFEQDLRGVTTKITNTTAGTTQRFYNGFGEIIKEITPNGITTFKFDIYGRQIERKIGDETTYMVFDGSFQGKLSSIKIYSRYLQTFTYDKLGRPLSITKQFEGKTFTYKTTYNAFGEVATLTYPNGFQLNYDYLLGDLVEVKNGSKSLWKLTNVDVNDRITDFQYGNGIKTTKAYDPIHGFLNNTKAILENKSVQDWDFKFDPIGNLLSQTDKLIQKTESYKYDNLNQLVQSLIPKVDTLTIRYDSRGNIIFKSDVGNYFWNLIGRLDSVQFLTGQACQTSLDADFTYTPFGKVKTISRDSHRYEITYGPDLQRIAQKHYINSRLNRTRYYDGLTEMDVYETGLTSIKNYVSNGNESFAYQLTDIRNITGTIFYFHQNHIGSIVAISNQTGEITEYLNFDAWGRRRNNDWTLAKDTLSFSIDRGFTFHEHYDLFNLVDMNGRIYDATLSIFLSPDPVYQSFAESNDLNRYAYVGNNPLSRIDPSGYSWWNPVDWVKSGANYVKDNWKPIVTTAVSVAVGATVMYFGGGPVLAGMASGFAGGLTGSLLNGQSVGSSFTAGFKGAVIGGFSGGLTFAVGSLAGLPGTSEFTYLKYFTTKIIGHSVVQGVVSKAQGGSVLSGMAAGAFSGAANAGLAVLPFQMNYVGGLAASMVVGGTASELAGGNFANGAIAGAFVYMFNDAAHKQKQKEEKAYKTLIVGQKLLNFKNSLLTGAAGFSLANRALDVLSVGLDAATGQWLEVGYGAFELSIATASVISATMLLGTTAPLWIWPVSIYSARYVINPEFRNNINNGVTQVLDTPSTNSFLGK
jgi:RHS repeat-associated protein